MLLNISVYEYTLENISLLFTVYVPGDAKISGMALLDRRGDLVWIRENLHILLPSVEKAFTVHERGAIVVDTTSRPTGEGRPFWLIPKGVCRKGK